MRKIKIDGAEYTLRPFTLKDNRRLKADTGVDLMGGLGEKAVDPDVLVSLAVIATEGRLTKQQIDDGLDLDGVGQILAFIADQRERMSRPIEERERAKEADPLVSSSAARP